MKMLEEKNLFWRGRAKSTLNNNNRGINWSSGQQRKYCFFFTINFMSQSSVNTQETKRNSCTCYTILKNSEKID